MQTPVGVVGRETQFKRLREGPIPSVRGMGLGRAHDEGTRFSATQY